MKFKWPLVLRKTMDAKVASELDRIREVEAKRRASMQRDWDAQWAPLLKKAIALTASRSLERGDFAIHVGVDRDMMEMGAMHNDASVWEYLSERLSYEFKRQISTLNFAGLHRLASETERRYPPRRVYAEHGPVRFE